MYCSNCGAKIDKSDQFCPSCGKPTRSGKSMVSDISSKEVQNTQQSHVPIETGLIDSTQKP